MFKFVNFLFLLVLLNGCATKPGKNSPESGSSSSSGTPPTPVIPANKACSDFGQTDCPAPRCGFYNNACKDAALALQERQTDNTAEQKRLEQEKTQKENELKNLKKNPVGNEEQIKQLEQELDDLNGNLDKTKKEGEKLEEETKNQEELKKPGTNNNKEEENLAKYNEQFKDYVASFNAPQDPPKWDLLGGGEQNNANGKYDLPDDVINYIAGIDDVKADAKKDMSSKNPVVILKSTAKLPNLDKAVLKMGNIAPRSLATSAAHETVKNKNLNMLYVPKFATGQTNKGESYILEELIDVDASHEFQENLYTNLFTKAKTDNETKDKLTEMFEQLTTFACLSDFNDIKYDNLPLAKDVGKVILLDVEKGNGDIMRLLNEEVSEFYIPSEYIDTIVRAAKDSGNDFCKALADAKQIAKAKEDGDKRYEFLKGFAEFKGKKGIINGKEKFTDENIKKAQDALTEDLDKKFVEAFLTDLNNSKHHDSRVVMMSPLNISNTNKKYNEGFTYKYFQGNDVDTPAVYAPFSVPLKKLIELGFIYGFVFDSDKKNIDNIVNVANIKSIYF